MTLSTVWELARENSVKTSDLIRQIAFAGIALIWALRDPNTELSKSMLIAGGLLVLTLAMDLFQHVVTTGKYRAHGSRIKKELNNRGIPNDKHGDQDVPLPEGFHEVAGRLFWGKVTVVSFAYIAIMYYLVCRFVR